MCTKYEAQITSSVVTSFLACVLSMAFAFCIFETIGYTPLAISILLLTFIPTAVMLKIQEGIVTSSVIVMHLYSLKQITWLIVGNEIAILTIGISVALLVNMYMPSSENKLKEYQDKIENNFKTILFEMVVYLRNRESSWSGAELIETENMLNEARDLSFKNLRMHLCEKMIITIVILICVCNNSKF